MPAEKAVNGAQGLGLGFPVQAVRGSWAGIQGFGCGHVKRQQWQQCILVFDASQDDLWSLLPEALQYPAAFELK